MNADDTGGWLRKWPRTSVDDLSAMMRASLAACVSALDGTGALAVWEEREEPGFTIALYRPPADLQWIERDGGDTSSGWPLVVPEFEDRVFYEDGAGGVRWRGGAAFRQEIIDADLRREYAIGPVMVVPLRGETVQGRVFVFDPGADIDAGLRRAAAIASLLTFQLDAAIRWRFLRTEAAEKERIRVARDLHDGLLQSFTGIVLQLETVHALLHVDPAAAATQLTQVQSAIMADQRELRAYVEALRPKRRGELTFDFVQRMSEMRERFEVQWGIRVDIDTASVEPQVGGALGQETFRIVQEAVANSARHGGASRVDVRLRTSEGMLMVDVRDDGMGFPAHGRYTLAQMREQGIGPRSLAERVAALNGDLTAESAEGGLTLEIAVPLGWAGN